VSGDWRMGGAIGSVCNENDVQVARAIDDDHSERIVRSVNCHEEFASVSRDIVRMFGPGARAGTEGAALLERIRAVLKKARSVRPGQTVE